MTYQENGYMTEEIFLEWLEHFKNNVLGGITKENKHLLILDGHISHVTNEAIKVGTENGLDILTLPSHCSHEMQPLDIAIFHPFKLNLAMEKMQRMRKNPNWAKGVTMKSNLAEMLAQALAKALKPQNIKSEFLVTSIFSLNKATMDAKFGLQLDSETLPQENQRNQVETPIPGIFSHMGLSSIQTPMPSLSLELDLSNVGLSQMKQQSFDQLVPNSQNEGMEDLSNVILESLSHLSLEPSTESQGASPTHLHTSQS